jgi:hypothetical protein
MEEDDVQQENYRYSRLGKTDIEGKKTMDIVEKEETTDRRQPR